MDNNRTAHRATRIVTLWIIIEDGYALFLGMDKLHVFVKAFLVSYGVNVVAHRIFFSLMKIDFDLPDL